MLFHNFAAFSLRRTRNELGGQTSDTAQCLVCPPFAAKTARQFPNDLQWDPDPLSLQGKFKITMLLKSWPTLTRRLSGPLSAQWERDPVILQATETH